jgi:hypothetical protein
MDSRLRGKALSLTRNRGPVKATAVCRIQVELARLRSPQRGQVGQSAKIVLSNELWAKRTIDTLSDLTRFQERNLALCAT